MAIVIQRLLGIGQTDMPPGSWDAGLAPVPDPCPLPRRVNGWVLLLLFTAAALLGGCGSSSNPVIGLTGLSLNPTTVKGGTSVTGTVGLNSGPATAAAVTLASSNPTVAPVPETVSIAAGATTATFTITTTAVSTNTSVVIFATEGGFTGMTTLTVTP